jgi:hypothetical protein
LTITIKRERERKKYAFAQGEKNIRLLRAAP